ncbi:MAG: efflux RND transporter permease subunit [Spirochaetales bacterium]|nr:efflux RND transporter permease subunit [Spirochaetales bacterium]
MKVSKFSVQHTVITGMILITIVVFGIYSLVGMNIAFISDISSPTVVVVAIYPGASAKDLTTDVVDVFEDDFVTLPNFKSVDSVAKNSYGIITITYNDGVDPYDQLEEVRNRISQLQSDLPDGLQGTPEAFVGGSDLLPIASFTVEGGNDVGALTNYLEEDLKPQITRIPGVSTVKISGGKDVQLNIKLRVDDLASKNISITQIYQVLSYSNINLPLGNGEYNGRTIDFRYDGSYENLDEIKDVPVGSTDDKQIIYLSDVADVSLGYPEEDYYVSSGDKDVVMVEIMKRSDGNTVEITKQLKKILKKSSDSTDGTISYRMISDDSKTVSASLNTVIQSGLMGVLIAIITVFIFLNDIMATIIIGLSIPLSILVAFIGMKVVGISINLMSLSGLVVALGSIVGGAIVVLEQVYRYYQDLNDDGTPRIPLNQCIYRGSDEVGKSVLGSTMTTVVVFIPIAMLNGIVGQILFDVSMTFMMALLASMVVAIFFVPFFLKVLLKDDKRKKPRKSFILKGIDKLENLYKNSLDFVLEDYKFIIIIGLCIMALTVYSVFQLSVSFIPSTDNSDFYVSISFPEGYSLDQTKEGMREAEEVLKKNVPEINSIVVFSGKEDDPEAELAVPNKGYMHVVLVPVAQRNRDIHDIIRKSQVDLKGSIPDADVEVTNGGFDKLVGYVSGGGGYGLTLVGTDEIVLYKTALKIEEKLKSDPEIMATALNASYDTETAVIDVTYDYLSNIGLTSYEAGIATAILFNGVDIGKYSDDTTGDRYDLHLFSDVSDAPIDSNTLNNLQIISQATGNTINFSNIAELKTEKAPNQINHKDRAQTITISGITTGESTMGVSQRMSSYLAANPLPQGIEQKVGGIGELLNDSIAPMLSALAISVFLVYFVMVVQFEKFTQPLLILVTIPFCIIGVVIALLIFNSSLSLLSMLGIISLGGMTVNNGIILIDYMNMLRTQKREEILTRNGVEFDEDTKLLGLLSFSEEHSALVYAITFGASSRLRPILMTTLSTMLGVLPMAVASGEGAEIYAPLGQAIAGGLITSTIITVYLIPILYYMLERRLLRISYKRMDKSIELDPEEPEQVDVDDITAGTMLPVE